MNSVILKIAAYPEQLSEIQPIRVQVFQIEQGVDPAIDFDGLDETSDHVLAYLDRQPVGTVRIRYLNEQLAKIERLAVLASARGQGVGKQLMEEAIAFSRQKEIEQVLVHAQEYVKGLYEKMGFEPVGERFEEAGLFHIKMIKRL